MAKVTTIRILIDVASAHQWHISQMDVKNVFLNGNLQEVYMYLHKVFLIIKGKCVS